VTVGGPVLVLGGARSGKSAYAETLLRNESAVDYIATADHDPTDQEWVARIAQHRRRRPEHWTTVETTDLVDVLTHDGAAMLVDSITAWLTGAMYRAGMWTSEQGAEERLARAVDELVEGWGTAVRRVVAVSDEVGSGVVPESASGRQFRDALGDLNQRLAASADEVWLVTAGIPIQLR
jgi:adenosylcobinamide kinase / adenosylcobinamide-phosphate guanylyltransferase